MSSSTSCMVRGTGRFLASAVLAFTLGAGVHAAQLTRDGRPAAILVVPDSSAQAESAAKRIQQTVAEMSGARLEIVRESAADRSRLLPVYVGHTRMAVSRGLTQDKLKPEEIVLIATDRDVVVLGNEGPAGPRRQDIQRGTEYAAVELLHRLGVRWLWPDPSGHVIPKTANVILGNGEYRHAPKIYSRGMRMQVGMATFFPNVVAKFDRQPGKAELHDWPLYMRLGGSRSISAGHSFGNWYKRFFDTRPDYFATGPDGGFSWLHITDRPKVCVSNPAVLEQIVADAKAYYNKADNPRSATYSLTPNDGHGFCLCPNCRAMDNMSGRPESWNVYNNEKKRPEMITHVSLSDRYTKFWNQVAERLERETPGMTLGSLAYSVYRAKPIEVKKLHPNLAIGYVGGGYTNARQREVFLRDWGQWSEICSQMFWRPNFMKEGEGFPLVWATQIGEDLRSLISTGLVSVDMPNIHHHWGTQGLNYYMLARLMWDHTLEPSAVIDDYCRSGFGTAALPVRRYISRLEELTRDFARHQAGAVQDVDEAVAADEDPDSAQGGTQRGGGVSAWDVVWSDVVLLDLERCLVEAEAAVAPGTPEAVRVAFLREGLDFAKLEVLVRRGMDRVTAEASEENEYNLLLAVARVEQWLLANRDSKSVGVLEGAPYWWRGKRDVKLFGRMNMMGRAEQIGGNRYLLTVPAYSMRGRFTGIEFSADGRQWSAAEPYRVQHEYVAPAGAKSVHVRLTFRDAKGVTPQKPIRIEL